MEIDFWLERWNNNQIGFHQQHVNPYLSYFYGKKGPALEQRKNLKVFVPLCGKSKDMLWLAQNQFPVFGVECSERAVKDFFVENAVNYKYAEKDDHALYQATGLSAELEIYQGDFFSLQAEDLADITDIFDRASLVSFNDDLRVAYVKKMGELQKPGVRTLLVTLTYDQSQMQGPPFSISEDDVHALYAENFSIDKLCTKEIIEDESNFKQRGLTSLVETVYKLIRK